MEMATIGATEAGGCNRQALTTEDKAGRDCLLNWCQQAGYTTRIDAIGNIFAHREGLRDLPPVLAGSHLDTQPTGGKFDGIYGVLAALEVLNTLDDEQIETLRPLEVAVWTNEEGSRFPCAMMGSAVWAGSMPLEEALLLPDEDGTTVGQELNRIGYAGSIPATAFPVHAALELHIEQGPVLEAERKAIGIVAGVQHMSRHSVSFTGTSTHAGPTPMPMRKDPVRALSELLPGLYRLPAELGADTRVTVGIINTEPGSANTVPERVNLTVDLRHPEQAVYTRLLAELERHVAIASEHAGVQGKTRCLWQSAGIVFAPNCVTAIERATEALGLCSMTLTSGAGHDSCHLAKVAPTGMIFIPCEGGVSHNEAESITPGQATDGANTLLLTMMELANQP